MFYAIFLFVFLFLFALSVRSGIMIRKKAKKMKLYKKEGVATVVGYESFGDPRALSDAMCVFLKVKIDALDNDETYICAHNIFEKIDINEYPLGSEVEVAYAVFPNNEFEPVVQMTNSALPDFFKVARNRFIIGFVCLLISLGSLLIRIFM